MRTYLFLGSYRLLLASLVFIAHAYVITDLLNDILFPGTLAVSLFFVLSGFVIFSAYHSYYEGKPFRFLLNRALRIYPALWVSYFVSVLVIYVFPSPKLHQLTLEGYTVQDIFLALTAIAANLKSTPWGPLPPAWSIHVELKFYVLAAVFLATAGMIFPNGGGRNYCFWFPFYFCSCLPMSSS